MSVEYRVRPNRAKRLGLVRGRIATDDGFAVEKEAESVLEIANRFNGATLHVIFDNERQLKMSVKAGENLDTLIQRIYYELEASGIYSNSIQKRSDNHASQPKKGVCTSFCGQRASNKS